MLAFMSCQIALHSCILLGVQEHFMLHNLKKQKSAEEY